MSRTRATAALAAFLVVLTALAPAVGAAAAGSSGAVPAVDNESEYDTEAYVTGDGDVVLLETGDEDTDASNVSGHAGLNVTAGLAHVVAGSDDVDTNVTGDGTVWVTDSGTTANASLSAPRPDALQSLSVEATSTNTPEERSSSLSVDATMNLSGEATALTLLERAQFNGSTTTTATAFRTSGTATVQTALPVGMERQHSITLTQADGGFTLDASGEYAPENTSAWQSREAAAATLEDRFCTEGVECDVTIDSYDFDGERLDIEYTVSLPNAADTAVGAVRLGLGASEQVDEATAERLADHLDNASVDRISADLSVTGGDGTLTYDVAISNADDLALAGADVLEIVAESSSERMVDESNPMAVSPSELAERLRATVDAKKAVDSERTRSWNVSLTTGQSTATLQATVESSAPQWPAFVDELTASGINVSGAQEASLTADTDGDRVVVDATMSYEQDDWVNKTLTRLPAESQEAESVLEAVREADFQRARADWSLTESSMEVEAAVAVGNASALRAELPDRYSGVDAAYVSLDDQRATVRLNDAVDTDASASDVRDLKLVSEEANVTLADDHDRNFEQMNRTGVRSYLGLGTDSSDGFDPLLVAAGAAAVAAIGGAGVLGRRYL